MWLFRLGTLRLMYKSEELAVVIRPVGREVVPAECPADGSVQMTVPYSYCVAFSLSGARWGAAGDGAAGDGGISDRSLRESAMLIAMRTRNTATTPVKRAIIVPITTASILAADTLLIVEFPSWLPSGQWPGRRWQIWQRPEPALGEPTNASP
jgi:hypothetical protein